jgi:hypothetical protein
MTAAKWTHLLLRHKDNRGPHLGDASDNDDVRPSSGWPRDPDWVVADATHIATAMLGNVRPKAGALLS